MYDMLLGPRRLTNHPPVPLSRIPRKLYQENPRDPLEHYGFQLRLLELPRMQNPNEHTAKLPSAGKIILRAVSLQEEN